ncbi:HicB family toxin-antitoxin system [Oerskovia turbata]|uniref:HicB family toxin-antitoxin system n=1 Tax=Oerskovia turbata TaxID=1713 RepID=A0A4Q1KYD6_9CELL|nr:hypothetical protein [Oerskovia turbata]RXR26816.1 HicB family toxin-antitoxin system [Oerskovia turbata]RXR34549.1 HicB family toxin-antitoxin system [Oerskovia turbata]TGJ97826.1 HicB family toxin-antitoxin system [Actinotalea fermentans ATCC 43279 = JCM 9966 = DSM 3133]
MGTYTARARREGRWWMIEVPEIDGLTQARRLGDVEEMARELIAVTLDVPLDDVAVAVAVTAVGDVDVAEALSKIRDERAEAARLERQASAEARELARELASAELAMRDIGSILGVSHQRVAQLLASS